MDSTAVNTITSKLRLHDFKHGCANFCAITSSGEYALATSQEGRVAVFDLSGSRAMSAVSNLHSKVTEQCAISSQGKVCITTDLGGEVLIWNSKDFTQVWERLKLENCDRACGAAISYNGNVLVASFHNRQNRRGHVVAYAMPNFEVITSWKANLDLFKSAVCISDDGNLVAHCANGRVHLRDIVNKTELKWRVVGESHVSMSGNGFYLLMADEESLRLYDGHKDFVITLPAFYRSFHPFCAISRDGTRAVAAIAGNKFRVWDISSLTVIADIKGFKSHSRGCAISGDGSRVITCSNDGSVHLVDLSGIDVDAAIAAAAEASAKAEAAKAEAEAAEKAAEAKAREFKPIKDADIDDTVDVADASTEKEPTSESSIKEETLENSSTSVCEEPRSLNACSDDPEVALCVSSSREVSRCTDESTNANKETVSSASTKSAGEAASRAAFQAALVKYNRSSDMLLHVQSSVALKEFFGEEAIAQLEPYAVERAVRDADVERNSRITEDQFMRALEAIAKVLDNGWTSVFVQAAETRDGEITVPQAVSLIEMNDDDHCTKSANSTSSTENVLAAVELNAKNGTLKLDGFLAAVKRLGLKDIA